MNLTIEEYKTAIAHYDEQITLEAAKLEHASQAQRDEFQARIDAGKARIAKLDADLASAAAERDRLLGEITTAEQQESLAKTQVDTLQRKVQDTTEEIAASQNQEHDRLAAFGVNMNAVLAAIKKGRWFGHEPVGPLGLYVQLDDAAKWGDIMRISIGHQMRAFGITDTRDFGPLKAILQRHKKYVSADVLRFVGAF
jgi:structural maintenance of chromosomes protein 6